MTETRPNPDDRPLPVTDRNTAERVIRGVKEVAAIVALVLASVLMALLLAVVGAISQRLSDDTTPTIDRLPAFTCGPSGEDPC